MGWNEMKRYIHWNWTLVANGASSAERKLRSWSMYVYGKGPEAANVVRLRAVMTEQN